MEANERKGEVVNDSLNASLELLLGRAKSRVSPRTERGGICRCGSKWKDGVEVPVGWVEVSTEGRTTVRRCEQCRRVNPAAVAPSREASFQ